MTDRITVSGISAFGRHGVREAEKTEGQTFVVDVALEVDLAPAGGTDDLGRTVNYADVAAEVVAAVEGEPRDLIETLAEQIAATVLARPRAEAVEVTVHKPQAPVGVPFADVTVTVRRERDEQVVIALGANLGHAQVTLVSAVRQLTATAGLDVLLVSPLVETDPVGGPGQPAYLNAVLVARTRLTPQSLLGRLHRIEARHGRVRETRWGARTLDLDLIQYGDPGAGSDVTSAEPDLMLPHPRAHERGFVLVPWLAADAAAVLRVGDEVREVSELARQVDTGGVRTGPSWQPLGPVAP